MAIVQLRLDVDSEVYPELYAVLSSIGSAASRSERFRQLASSGLIWEHLRARAHPHTQVAVSTENAVAESRAKPVAQVGPALAVDDPDHKAMQPARQHTGRPRNPPILSDVVDLGAVSDRNRFAAEQSAIIPPSAKRAVEVVHNPAEGAVPEASVESASSAARKPESRSRLIRMKERGLFNNS